MTSAKHQDAPRVSLVAPVHNEVDNLVQLVEEAISALDAVDGGHEILLIDDGSEDGSGELVEELARRHPTVRGFRRSRRGGQSAAVLAGLQAARGDVVVTIDSDLQNDPADIPRLLEHLEDHDLVGGVRVDRHDGWHRRAASRFANSFRRLVLGDSFRDVGCSLKAYRAEFLQDLPPFDGLHRFLPVIVESRGARVTEIPVRHRARRFGESKYSVGGRAVRGLFDLLAIRWWRRREILPSSAREIGTAEGEIDADRHFASPRRPAADAVGPSARSAPDAMPPSDEPQVAVTAESGLPRS